MEGLHTSANHDITKIILEGVPDRPGIAAEIFLALGDRGFNVELVVSTGGYAGRADISLAVQRSQQEDIVKMLDTIRGEIGWTAVRANSDVALVSIFGQHLSTEPGIAGRTFRALSSHGINIEAISTSMSSVTCLIDDDKVAEAIAALKTEFSIVG